MAENNPDNNASSEWATDLSQNKDKAGGILGALIAGVLGLAALVGTAGLIAKNKSASRKEYRHPSGMGERFNALSYDDKCAVVFGILAKELKVGSVPPEQLDVALANLAERYAHSPNLDLNRQLYNDVKSNPAHPLYYAIKPAQSIARGQVPGTPDVFYG